jgi:2-(1,2-epoxy-1,2-dihydrophenyl)acetyl-CoA isomerase
MKFETLQIIREGAVANLILNRPEVLNALSEDMAIELDQALDHLGREEHIRVVVLTGAGRAFCAGGDLKNVPTGRPAQEGIDFMHQMHRWFIRFFNLSKPTIASVNGLAMGAGFNLALAADLVIASEKALFGQSFVKVGAIPDLGGLYLLPRLIGLQKAKELIFTGGEITAKQAKELSLVNFVVPHEALREQTTELAQKLAKGPARAMSMAKSIMHRGLSVDILGVLELEAYAQASCFEGDEHVKGVQAFLEKRSHDF